MRTMDYSSHINNQLLNSKQNYVSKKADHRLDSQQYIKQ